MTTLPELGDRVAVHTPTGAVYGRICGYGICDTTRSHPGDHDRDELDRAHSIVLVDLDSEHVGDLIPPEWPAPGACPAPTVSVLVVRPEEALLVGRASHEDETDREPLDLAVCKTCGRDIVYDSYGVHGWIDADGRTDPNGHFGQPLVYCHDQDETHDGIRHEPIA